MTERHWLSVVEAAAFFGLKRKNLYSLIARHQLPAGVVVARFGKLIRLNVEMIEAGAGLKGRKP